ncbi:MAG: hypothetical protein JNN17_09080 [Verrucomicrobiaceae bacterium]|nr:hypothetical protein [Verrucomicrobiaceae bacterium]
MLRSALTLLTCLLCLPLLVVGETRFFVSTAGSLLEAEIVGLSGDKVTLRKKDDGGVLTVPRTTLCREDQAHIDAWAAAHPDAAPAPSTETSPQASAGPKFSLTSNVRSAKSTRGGVDGGYRTIDLAYNIQVQNREVTRELKGAKITIFTFARPADAGDDRLYLMQKLEFPIDLRAQGKFEQKTPEVRLGYYQGLSSRDGTREHGYLLVVTDAAGVVQHVDGTPDGLQKRADEALKLTAPSVLDRDFRAIPSAPFPSSIELIR